ncbi:histidine triad nucleotide-binding protein [soil metagenome]
MAPGDKLGPEASTIHQKSCARFGAGELMIMDCIFCRIAAGTLPATRILETDDVVAFRDLNPQAPTHALVIPRRHLESLDDLGPGDGNLAGALLLATAEVARLEGIADTGYRVVANTGEEGGQAVGHLHLHVLGGRQLGWPPG